jgi:ATPase
MIETENIISGDVVIIPVSVLDELQAQASTNKEHGFVGLDEVIKLRSLCKEKNITLAFPGGRPTLNDIILAKKGRIDAIIGDLALQENAVLVTADYVQALSSEALGLKTMHISPSSKKTTLQIEKYLDDSTLSLHLKENAFPMAKKGSPRQYSLVKLSDTRITYEEITQYIKEIFESSKLNNRGITEINKIGATVIQLQNYRTVITRPPFSNSVELTIVKPITKLSISDYDLSEKMMKRLEKAEGIIVSGSPGSGKSTFATSLVDYYVGNGKIVKTFESPKDLQVPEEVTQYGPLEGSFENAIDILLLVRPDYTIFDEIRRASDFNVFADIRLAGVGMIGVVHANAPVDTIQRFIKRIDLGMIPHLLDTVIFIEKGVIKKIYELSLVVKVPTGLTESDLARPLVEVRDFENERIEYEIYTFGEEKVIVPIKTSNDSKNVSPIEKLALTKIKDVLSRFDPTSDIEIIDDNNVRVIVTKNAAPRLIGKGGSTITDIENILGIKIHVDVKTQNQSEGVDFEINESNSAIIFTFSKEIIGKKVEIYLEDELIVNIEVGKKARVKIDKRSQNGKKLMMGMATERGIRIYLVN